MSLLAVSRLAATASVACVLLAACGSDCPNCPGRPASVAVSPGVTSVLPQQAVQLTVLVRDQNDVLLAGYDPAWRSLDAGVATVDTAGMVTGVAVGTARIVAEVTGKEDTGSVTVLTNPVFAADVFPVLKATCATGFCHLDGGIAPEMDVRQQAYDTLTAVGRGYLTAGDSTVGLLRQKLRGAGTTPMPPAEALLTLQPGNYALIMAWIAQGALP